MVWRKTAGKYIHDVREPSNSPKYHPGRLWWGVGSAAALDVGGMVLLHQFWYSNTERTSWHFYDRAGGKRWYDDWFTYKQQDKLGHLYSSWALSRAAIAYGHWSGLSRRNAAFLGMGSSLFFHLQIEFFDGFSDRYGASRTDLLANATGSAIAGLQHLYPRSTNWFALKYSYHPSPYYEPSRYLGNGIQDYQGITFWISLRPERVLPSRASSFWPDWLALSVGHSGVGLGHPVSGVGATPEHRRQLFVGPDIVVGELIDLPDSWSAVEHVLSFVRLPLPVIQVTPNTDWRWAYF